MITVLYGNPCTVPVLFCKKIGITDENRSFSKIDHKVPVLFCKNPKLITKSQKFKKIDHKWHRTPERVVPKNGLFNF